MTEQKIVKVRDIRKMSRAEFERQHKAELKLLDNLILELKKELEGLQR